MFTWVLPVCHNFVSLYCREMEIYFPKFKLDQEYGLHKLLKQLGIREVFSTRANLSEISATARDLRVSKVSLQGFREAPTLGKMGKQ